MMLSQRTRANTSVAVGCGGSKCVCCADAPKFNKKNRRTVRRVEKREWKNNADLH